MATPNHGLAAARPEATTSTKQNGRHSDADAVLAQSMQQISLDSPRAANGQRPSPRSPLPHPIHPPTPSTDRNKLGVSPNGSRSGPRSPFPRTSPQGRSGTPSLMRKASTNSLQSTNGAAPARELNRKGSSVRLASPSPGKHSPASPRFIEEEVRPVLTEASIASTYFKSELDVLHGPESTKPSETVVILHDSCYGHRFSRPMTTKVNLANVVERPERLQACAVGVALAYVRLGDRHCDGSTPIHPGLDPQSMPSIPFRIHKTSRAMSLASPAVTNVHGSKWMEELKAMCEMAEEKLAAGNSELKRPDMDRGPGAAQPPPFHEGDLYLCKESLAALEGALGAMCEAVDVVFTSPVRRAFVAVRPPGHHCSASHPQGFCWLNNVHVGIMHGLMNHSLTHAAIIDFDLHHGDGSQAIAWDHNTKRTKQAKNAAPWKKASIGYFSLHDINSYPCESGDIDNIKNASLCIENAHGQNIWNVHLQEWKDEVDFWKLYRSKYSILLDKMRNYLRRETERLQAAGQEPKAAIFLSAGFDASEWEGAGMQRHTVNVPTEFYARITRDVVRIAAEEGLAVEGRVISALEGGYSDRAISSGVFSHISGLAGTEPLGTKDDSSSRFGREISRRISSVTDTLTNSSSPISRRSTVSSGSDVKGKIPGFPYDPSWWSQQELERLEAAKLQHPIEQFKVLKHIIPPTYCSPTTSSISKARDPSKVCRTPSGLLGSQTMHPRAPTPPPPEVTWPVAAVELSKHLIPKDRTVSSVTWEEIKADTNRIKRDRLAVKTENDAASEAPEPTAGVRKSTRERKPVKAPSPVESEASRRRTLPGSAPSLIQEKVSPDRSAALVTEPESNPNLQASARGIPSQVSSKPSRQTSRRLSGTSSVMTGFEEEADPSLFTAPSYARPDTSQSIRPESSISVRNPVSTYSTNNLDVKRTRPTAPQTQSARDTAKKGSRVSTAGAKSRPKKKADEDDDGLASQFTHNDAPMSMASSALPPSQRPRQNSIPLPEVSLQVPVPAFAPTEMQIDTEMPTQSFAQNASPVSPQYSQFISQAPPSPPQAGSQESTQAPQAVKNEIAAAPAHISPHNSPQTSTRAPGQALSVAPSESSKVSPGAQPKGASDAGDDVSKLTNGVKKITLVTKEMREAREAEKKAQAAKRSADAKPAAAKARKPAAPKTASTAAPVDSKEDNMARNPKLTTQKSVKNLKVAEKVPQAKAGSVVSRAPRPESPDPLMLSPVKTREPPQGPPAQSFPPPQSTSAAEDAQLLAAQLNASVSSSSVPGTPTTDVQQPPSSANTPTSGSDGFAPYPPKGFAPQPVVQRATPKPMPKGHQFTPNTPIRFAAPPANKAGD